VAIFPLRRNQLRSVAKRVSSPNPQLSNFFLFCGKGTVKDMQARDQLGTPDVAVSFLRGAQNFQPMTHSFNCTQHIFQGERKILQGGKASLRPPCYGPEDIS